MNYSLPFASLLFTFLFGCAQQNPELSISPAQLYQQYYADLDKLSTIDDFHQLHMRYGSARVRLEIVGKAADVEISSVAEKEAIQQALEKAFQAIRQTFPPSHALDWPHVKEGIQNDKAMVEVSSRDKTLQVAALLVKEQGAWKIEQNFVKRTGNTTKHS